MALMFVVGLMNVVWTVVLTLWIVGEKMLPRNPRMVQLAGAALIGWGFVTLATARYSIIR